MKRSEFDELMGMNGFADAVDDLASEVDELVSESDLVDRVKDLLDNEYYTLAWDIVEILVEDHSKTRYYIESFCGTIYPANSYEDIEMFLEEETK